MTQEEKSKRYDEALEIAKKNYVTAQDLCEGSKIGVECFKNTLENIFPELKGKEDERIREALIALLKFGLEDGSAIAPRFNETKEQALAWLEKQSKHKPKTNPCEKCNHPMLNCHNFPCGKKKTFDQGKSALEAIREERVDNANKIEPKFKLGDRIRQKNQHEVCLISEVCDNHYLLNEKDIALPFLCTNSSKTIMNILLTNKELQDLLKQYPDDAIVVVEYCNVRELKYIKDRNLIVID